MSTVQIPSRPETLTGLSGQFGRLSLAVAEYRPTVRCEKEKGTPLDPEKCQVVLDHMPAIDSRINFGHAARGHATLPGVQVRVPHVFADRE